MRTETFLENCTVVAGKPLGLLLEEQAIVEGVIGDLTQHPLRLAYAAIEEGIKKLLGGRVPPMHVLESIVARALEQVGLFELVDVSFTTEYPGHLRIDLALRPKLDREEIHVYFER